MNHFATFFPICDLNHSDHCLPFIDNGTDESLSRKNSDTYRHSLSVFLQSHSSNLVSFSNKAFIRGEACLKLH